MLKPNLNEYQEMATDLATSGFSPHQTEGLVRLLDQVFSRQEAANERIVHELRESQKEFREEFRGDMSELRKEIRADMDGLRGEIRGNMDGLRGEVNGDMSDLRGEFRTDMKGLRTELVEIRRWTIMTLTAVVMLMLGSVLGAVTS